MAIALMTYKLFLLAVPYLLHATTLFVHVASKDNNAEMQNNTRNARMLHKKLSEK